MKKIIMLCVLLTSVLTFAGCARSIAESNPSPVPAVATTQPEFNYILVKEADTCYLHKLGTWYTKDGIVIFTCPVCGNTIRVPETDVIMYDTVTIETAWSNSVNVCSGTANDWQDLLGK